MTAKDRDQVKKAAREIFSNLKNDKLALDWRKRQQSRAKVLVAIEDFLDNGLPPKFSPDIYRQKCGLVYQHVYDSYYGEGRSVYAGEA